MKAADIVATITLLSSLGAILWIGVDSWILTAWGLVALVLLVLFLLGRLLAKELGIAVRRGRRYPWFAGATGSFVSCTMAAGLVRSQAPVATFWALGALMVCAVASLRLAYHRPKAPETAN